MFEFLSQMKIPIWGKTYVKGEGILECHHFGQNGSGVLCRWRKTDHVCWGKMTFSGINELYKKSFQGLHWLQKLGPVKALFGAKVV